MNAPTKTYKKICMDPLVTFVVPCYKLAHLLPECINSILAQTYVNFELLIMDNCSPDNTSEVAQSFHDPRVRYVHNETNIGHIRNFNKGIMMARGKYVWVVSADDSLRSPHVLGRFVDVMERNPDVGYTFCRSVEVQGEEEAGVARFNYGNKDRIWDGSAFLPRLIQCNRIAQSSSMVRSEYYHKVGLFPLDLPYAGDWYLWCVLALNSRVAYFSEPMVRCRVHEESLTTLFNRGEAPVCILDELNVLWRICREAELMGVTSLRSACNASIASRAARALKSGPLGGARPGLREADFLAILRRHVTDVGDEEDIWARVYTSLGDEQYWDGEYDKAARSYWRGLSLRPWRLKNWTKYILLMMGSVGVGIRRVIRQLRSLSAGASGAHIWTQ